MVAYDSRRMPDPAQQLHAETIARLRRALEIQRRSGRDPVPELIDAVRAASREARQRSLPAELLVLQLRVLADELGLPQPLPDSPRRKEVREWIVSACLRAYWDIDRDP